MTIMASGMTPGMTAAPGVVPSRPDTWQWQGSSRWFGWMTPEVAASLPGIGRGLDLITGQIMQMPLDDFRGVEPLPRPRLLEQPDPEQSRAWFVQVQAIDYLLNGNAVHYVTSYDAAGWPAAVTWLPSQWVNLVVVPYPVDGSGAVRRQVEWWVGGVRLDTARVVHVKRKACSWAPWRGIGVVEQHLDALTSTRDQHAYEATMLSDSAVPSVAVIAPNPRLGQEEADEAVAEWQHRYGGPRREPAILPNGTQVIPLSWSPSDSQLVEARELGLIDQANMLNLDGYWLGGKTSSLTYRSPGPMFLQLLKQTVGPILAVFEDVWSGAWLPRGRRVRFDRNAMLRDDLATMSGTAISLYQAGLWSREEARAYLGNAPAFPVEGTEFVSTTSPVGTVAVPTGDMGGDMGGDTGGDTGTDTGTDAGGDQTAGEPDQGDGIDDEQDLDQEEAS